MLQAPMHLIGYPCPIQNAIYNGNRWFFELRIAIKRYARLKVIESHRIYHSPDYIISKTKYQFYDKYRLSHLSFSLSLSISLSLYLFISPSIFTISCSMLDSEWITIDSSGIDKPSFGRYSFLSVSRLRLSVV